jgi:NADPH-dependent curcumin reductase CurA
LEKDVPLEGEHFGYKFKLGWQNGTKQFLEPISFDYKNGADVVEKAYTWSGRLNDLGKRNEFRMTGVVAPPQDESLLKHYAEAIMILRESPKVRGIIAIDEFDKFMPEIEKDLAGNHK